MVESLDDLDESRIHLATGVDGSLVTMSLPLEEQRYLQQSRHTAKNQKQYHKEQTSVDYIQL